jgi:hypothetical protein
MKEEIINIVAILLVGAAIFLTGYTTGANYEKDRCGELCLSAFKRVDGIAQDTCIEQCTEFVVKYCSGIKNENP